MAVELYLEKSLWTSFAALVLFAHPAMAQTGEETPVSEPDEEVPVPESDEHQQIRLKTFSRVQDIGMDELKTTDREEPGNLSFVPVPILNPTLGIGGGAAAIYTFGGGRRRSTLAAGGGATKNGSWAIGAGAGLHMDDDRFRVGVAGAVADLKLKFYGVGPGSFFAENPIDFSGSGWLIQVKPEIRVARSTYVGMLVRYMDANITTKLPIPVLPEISVPFNVLSVGPVVEYDSRDNANWPTSGTHESFEYLFSRETLGIFNSGIEIDFTNFDASASAYFGFSEDLVLAVNGRAAGASEDTPFFLKPSVSLRGYSSGEVLNDNILQGQAELRWMMNSTFGVVAFMGVGASGKSLTSYDDSGLSYGAGVRYRFSQIDKSNIGFDFAKAGDNFSVYFTVGEAF